MQQQGTEWLTAIKVYKKCPRCKQGILDTRIKRGRIVKTFLFWLDLKRYSCNTCSGKSYLLSKQN